MLKMLDLFSGIGGFSLAADWTGGIETVAFCEIESYCQKVLKKHWPDVPIYPDIKELKGEQIGQPIDIVCGGFPCQPFSCAGKQRGKEDDRHLWPEMFRVIQECKPTWVVGENVTGLIELALEDCFVDLEAEGYEVQPIIVPACAVNAPHRRDRVWILAHSRNNTGRNGERGSFRRNGSGSMEKTEWAAPTTEIAGSSKTSGVMAYPTEFRPVLSQSSPRYRQELSTDRNFTQQGYHKSRSKNNWDIEPDVGRVAYGISDRVHRLKALGNSIVPQVAYQILQGIVDIERSLSDVD